MDDAYSSQEEDGCLISSRSQELALKQKNVNLVEPSLIGLN